MTAEAIATESGVSLRTFYRYFASKDEVLAPLIATGTEQLAEHLAARPEDEDLLTAFERAFAQISRDVDREANGLIALLISVPVLRARWMGDLRMIEDALVPVICQRAREPLDEPLARLTAAGLVAALRVTLEHGASADVTTDPGLGLGVALRHLGDGAGL